MSSTSTSSKPSGIWQPPTLEEMQAMLPQYRFISLLGRGGMGAVYKAVQLSLDRAVAIKVLPGDLVTDEDSQFAERFKNEARTMAKMSHPSIVNLWDFGETRTGLLFIVMEFIDGTDVAQMILSQGKLPEEYALSITAHVCDALNYAHRSGIIHRDIKPANILINRDGAVKVADFGLAKQSDPTVSGLTKTNMAMGTPDFVAPEAFIPGFALDGRADLYAIGVMLYQMLTGEVPRGMWTLPGSKIGTDPRFDAIIAKAMQTDRECRYQSAAEIRQELDSIVATPRALLIQRQQEAAEAAARAIQAQKLAEQQAAMKPPAAAPQKRPVSSPKLAAAPAPPVKKKSNAGLWLGVAAAIGLGAGLIFLSKPSEQSQEPASTVANPAEPTETTPGPATQATSGKPVFSNFVPDAKWVDEMKSPRPWGPPWKLVGTEMHVAGGKTAQRLADTRSQDAGLRVRFRFCSSGEGSFLDLIQRLNKMGIGPRYLVTLRPSEKLNAAIDLLPLVKDGARRTLTTISAQPSLGTGREHTAEFYAIGQRLTLLLNGQEVGSVSDSTFQYGFPGILVGTGAEVISMETAVIKEAPPAPPPPARPIGVWQPVFTEAAKKAPGITELPDGWVRMDNGFHSVDMGKDMAVRGRVRIGAGRNYAWPLRFRDHSNGGLQHYGLSITKSGTFLLHRRVQNGSVVAAEDKSLREVPTGISLENGTEFDLEVSAQGDRLSVKLNGEVIIDVPDTFHQGERTNFGSDTAIIEFKNLEWQDLSGQPSATSKKLTSKSPPATVGSMDLAARQKSLAAPLSPGVSDVLEELSLKSDATFSWSKTPAGIELKPLIDPGPYKGCVNFPTALPNDYAIEAWFTNSVDGGSDVGLTIPVGDGLRTTCWLLPRVGGWVGLGKVDGKDPHEPDIQAGCSSSFMLTPGELTFMRAEVRRTSGQVDIRFMVNGLLMATYSGPTSRLNLSSAWIVGPEPELASLGGRAVTFHRAIVHELSQTVKLTAAALKDPRLLRLEAGFQARYESDAQKPYLAAVEALNQSYVKNGGDSVPPVDPPDTPEPLKKLRNIYRTALAKLEAARSAKAAPLYDIYLKALDDYIVELTKADKIPEATQVSALRDQVARDKSAAVPSAATAPPK
jgi:hypothetical protein